MLFYMSTAHSMDKLASREPNFHTDKPITTSVWGHLKGYTGKLLNKVCRLL